MGGGPYLGWICGSAVAVGIGIAVGTGCAVASAETPSVSSSTDSPTHTGTEEAKSAPSGDAGGAAESDRDGEAVTTGEFHESADEGLPEREPQSSGELSGPDDRSASDDQSCGECDDAAVEPDAEDASGPADVAVRVKVRSGEEARVTVGAPPDDERPAAVAERPEVTPTPESQKPTRAVTVSSAAPAVEVQPNSSVGDTATPSPVVRRQEETSAGASLTVQPVVPVESSLTYTPGPTFLDNLALLFHEAFRLITDITGVNVYMLIQSLLVSDNPPGFLRYGLDTRRTEYTANDGAEWDVWEFRPPNPTGKTVIALHGGGWIYQPNLLHWIDYTDMARQTGATVIVPLYPLADTPAGRAEVVIPETAEFISNQIELNCGPENVSIYADSAGSSIAMAAVSELVQTGRPVPSSMVLLSMVADTTLQNPAIRDINDPIFNIDKLGGWTSYWPMNIDDPRDPRLSPLFMDDEVLRGLPPTTIYVGEREILYPDTLLLYQKAVAAGAPISVVVGTGQIHDWPLSGLAISSQTAAVRPGVFCQLGLDRDCAAAA